MFESSILEKSSGPGAWLPSIHGGGDATGGGLVGVIDKLLENLSRATEPGGGFEILPGIQTLGPNIHPSLVHFPIALLSIFFLLELLGSLFHREGLRQSASAMLYFGALGAAAAAAAGLYAASFVPHSQEVHGIMEWHERLGITVTILALILSVWRLVVKGMIAGMARAFHLLLATIMMVCMIFGADLGGLMVYGYGVAVTKLQDPGANVLHHHHQGPIPVHGGGD